MKLLLVLAYMHALVIEGVLHDYRESDWQWIILIVMLSLPNVRAERIGLIIGWTVLGIFQDNGEFLPYHPTLTFSLHWKGINREWITKKGYVTFYMHEHFIFIFCVFLISFLVGKQNNSHDFQKTDLYLFLRLFLVDYKSFIFFFTSILVLFPQFSLQPKDKCP